MKFLSNHSEGVCINIKVNAGSKQNRLQGIWQEGNKIYLKVSIKAKAVDGKANSEIISYFSSLFSLSKSLIIITQGEFSSYKKILLSSQDEDNIKIKLNAFINEV